MDIAWRRDRSLHYGNGYSEHGSPWTSQSGNADCNISADRCICDRNHGMVRGGTAAVGVAQGHWYGNCDCRCGDFQMVKEKTIVFLRIIR